VPDARLLAREIGPMASASSFHARFTANSTVRIRTVT
jgi:hypothetical protein